MPDDWFLAIILFSKSKHNIVKIFYPIGTQYSIRKNNPLQILAIGAEFQTKISNLWVRPALSPSLTITAWLQ